jgi:YD repeat-containing protein
MKNYLLKSLLLSCLILGQAMGQISSVSHATGTMYLNIPIYTLKEGAITVPISVSYTGGGVAVGALASNVGVNWSLNAGGSISRTTQGLPDESYTNTHNIAFRGYLYENYPSTEQNAFLRDYEPDIFNLSLNGTALRFMLKKEVQNNKNVIVPVLLDETDISIQILGDTWINDTCTDGVWDFDKFLNNVSLDGPSVGFPQPPSFGISSFVVTTTDGLKYYFGTSVKERDYTLSISDIDKNLVLQRYTEFTTANACPNVWHLSKIEYPNSTGIYQSVTFKYARRIQNYTGLGYDKESCPIDANCNDIPKKAIVSNFFTYKCELSNIVADNTEIQINPTGVSEPQNINSIIPDYTGGQFSNFDRADVFVPQFARNTFTGYCNQIGTTIANPFSALPKSQSFNLIVIKDKATQIRTGYYLHHDYFSDYTYSNNLRSEFLNGRLNLRGIYPVKFINNQSTELLSGHSFVYNGKTLPSATSLARDAWGYYNGADSNEALGCAYKVPGASCNTANSANIRASLDFGIIGSLAFTKLPTGGTEAYTYDLHDCSNYLEADGYSKIGGLRIRKIKLLNAENNDFIERQYDYLTNEGASSGYLPICPIFKSTILGVTTINPNLYNTLFSKFTNGAFVTYKNVKESVIGTKNGVQTNSGYSKYEFYGKEQLYTCKAVYTTPTDFTFVCGDATPQDEICYNNLEINTIFNYGMMPQFEMLRGFPKSVKHYTTDGILVHEELKQYNITSYGLPKSLKSGMTLPPYTTFSTGGGIVPNWVVSATNIASSITGWVGLNVTSWYLTAFSAITTFVNSVTYETPDVRPTIYNYTTPVQKVQLSKTITRSYEPTGTNPIETTTAYFYGSQKHNQVTKTTTYRSDALGANMPILSEQNIKYSADYTVPANSTDPMAKGVLGLQQRSMLVPIETLVKRKNKVVGGQFLEFYADTDKLGLLKASHSLELSQALNTFVMSDVVAGNMTKHSLYKKQQEILAYNERGLAKTTKNTTENGTTNLTFGVNNYYPTEVAYTSGTKTIVKKSEYATPLFGASKITNADNSTVSYTYDDLGRIKEIKDQNGYLVKSYIYNEKAIAAPTDAITFELWGNVGTNIKLQDLTNGSSVSLAAIPAPAQFPSKKVSVYITAPTGTDFVEISVLNNISTSGNRSFTDNESTIWGDVLSFNLLTGSSSNASYTAEAKAYSKGLMIAKKKISFTVSP